MTSTDFEESDEFEQGPGWIEPDLDVLDYDGVGIVDDKKNTNPTPQKTKSEISPKITKHKRQINPTTPYEASLNDDRRFLALQISCYALAGINIPTEIVELIFEISFEGVCCMRGAKCKNYKKLPMYAYRRDDVFHEINMHQHGQFIIGKTYDDSYIKQNAYVYHPDYIPLFTKQGKFIGYTCQHDYVSHYLKKYRFWGGNIGLELYKNIGISNGKYCIKEKQCCYKCRAVREKNDYKRCFLCRLFLCKIRCQKNSDLIKIFQLSMFNKNITRGLWKEFQVLIYDNDNDNETEVIQYLCETCIKNGNNRDTLENANYKRGRYVEVIPSNLYRD